MEKKLLWGGCPPYLKILATPLASTLRWRLKKLQALTMARFGQLTGSTLWLTVLGASVALA